MTELLRTGSPNAKVRILLAHGAGAGAEHPFLTCLSDLLASDEREVIRFNFPYMSKSIRECKRRPPDKEAVLLAHWRELAAQLAHPCLIIAGKSMGGRMAAQIADEIGAAGLLILGYPFCPPSQPDKWRGEVLKQIVTPTLLLQGERDPFGSKARLADFPFSSAVQLQWLTDGDHDFVPRKASGTTLQQNMMQASQRIIDFIDAQRGKPADN